jgi:hypothetical protein
VWLDGSLRPARSAASLRSDIPSNWEKPVPNLPVIRSETYEMLEPGTVSGQLERLGRTREALDRALRGAEERGYSMAPSGPGPAYGLGGLAQGSSAPPALGYRVTVEAAREIMPPADAAEGSGVRSAIFEILLQGYTRGADQAAAGTATVTAGDYSASYDFLLEAPGGNPQRIIESTLRQGALVEADGFWDRFKACLGGCGGTCLAAVPTCLAAGGNIIAIVGCLAVQCGSCAAKCLACATCNCSWWCRWAAGCCEG